MGHSNTEWIYIGVVSALLIWVGAESWRVEHSLEFAPPQSEIVRVIGQQWFWSFEHADGTKEVNELHLKAGVPYRFEIVSNDVVHSFTIPDFAVLMDAVPGRVNTLWNTFDVPGQYLIECREYCGMLHQDMRAKLFVEPNDGKTQPVSTSQPTGGSSGSGSEKPTIAPRTGTAEVVSPDVKGIKSQGTGTLLLVKPGNLTQSNQNASSSSNASSSTVSSNTTASAPGSTLTIPAGASTQGNPSYDPATITVKKGTIIAVKNDDTAPHTATNGDGPNDANAGKLFDTSIIMPGESGTIDTSKLAAGNYPFHCTVHPYMKGSLTVQ